MCETNCGQAERDKRLMEGIDNPSIIYYGPHPCETCGKKIVRGNKDGGFGDIQFDYPEEGWAYPNHNWTWHQCSEVKTESVQYGPAVGELRCLKSCHFGMSLCANCMERERLNRIPKSA